MTIADSYVNTDFERSPYGLSLVWTSGDQAHLRDWEKRAESAWETPKLPRSGIETKFRAESCLRSRRAYETGLGGMNGD